MQKDKRSECQAAILPIADALYVLQGKWRLPILLSLTFGNRGFRELEREVTGISSRMLSKELKQLEENQLLDRNPGDEAGLARVEYALTEHGRSLKPVLLALQDWGLRHRAKILRSE